MPKIDTYFEKKRALDQLSQELRDLEESKDLAREFEMIEKLKSVMSEYDVSASYLNGLLAQIDPSINNSGKANSASSSSKPGRKRRLMRFKNPHTGEVVETRGGNHATLKQWRREYGKETVDSWKEIAE